jgi:hypothetical protein
LLKKEDSSSNSDIFPLTKIIVLESFDEWTYTKGEEYFYANAVKSWKSTKKGIIGKVKGNWAPYYSVDLQIKNDHLNGTYLFTTIVTRANSRKISNVTAEIMKRWKIYSGYY